MIFPNSKIDGGDAKNFPYVSVSLFIIIDDHDQNDDRAGISR